MSRKGVFILYLWGWDGGDDDDGDAYQFRRGPQRMNECGAVVADRCDLRCFSGLGLETGKRQV